ncbi:Rho guanine nucleotide exchange factor 4 [Fragariocoptes setiger]|uniref:Rho guanine nucleotide exchange factor 4 n=1 Tax=Fragariocoptes setiger TaxID=1670756 RepID=A0ABQ7S6Q4_9ACAR|nr:Rho guanine nucleotide exchange factor 4 [Fragariocoptes setiger]
MYFNNEIINSIKRPTDGESGKYGRPQDDNEDEYSDDSDESNITSKDQCLAHQHSVVQDAPEVPLDELLAYYRYIQASVAESLLDACETNKKSCISDDDDQPDNLDVAEPIETSTENNATISDSQPQKRPLNDHHNHDVCDTSDKDERTTSSSRNQMKEKIRTNVVLELINSERDFVKHLEDVIEGYLYPARRHPEMFSPEQISNIFANIEALYEFQCEFLENLESRINWSNLAASEVGQCFLDYERGFDVYHEYCNNHPNAISELQDLFAKQRYVRFFEACRLLRSMIDISLDGFLLTPIQKICKYPLQLSELLKNTPEDHNDYAPVANAVVTMRRCASLANERKRRIEALADLISFQDKIDTWFGPKLWETSSTLIHSGEVTKMTSHTWSQSVHLYLFDHLLLYFKRDLLKRNSLMLRGRICTDTVSEIVDIEEHKVRKSFKLYCTQQQKWFIFTTRNQNEKEKWLKAFARERELVLNDEKQGFKVTERELAIARRALKSMNRTRSARYRSVRREKADTTIVDHLDLEANTMNRTLSLPSCIHPSHVMNFVDETRLTGAVSKKKSPAVVNEGGPGWFKKMGSKKMSKQSASQVRADLAKSVGFRPSPVQITIQQPDNCRLEYPTQGLHSGRVNGYSVSTERIFSVKEDTV